MFRKKQAPQNISRNVQKQTPANVFSYYSSRTPSDADSARRSEASGTNEKKKQGLGTKWLAYTPSIIAGLVLIACMVLVSTLDTKPRVIVVGADQQRSLVQDPESYETEIRTILERSALNRSKLLINTSKVSEEISTAFPELGQVAVVLPLVGRRPVVEIRPTEPALVLGSVEDTFVIDQTGRAVAYAKDVESSVRDTLPVLQDESGLALERGKVVMTSEAVSLVIEVQGLLRAKNVAVQSMTLPTTANELHVRIKDKPYFVKFDLRGEGRRQTGVFLAVQAHLQKTKKLPSEYIDVRVPDKAFYK